MHIPVLYVKLTYFLTYLELTETKLNMFPDFDIKYVYSPKKAAQKHTILSTACNQRLFRRPPSLSL